jgi:hypothetical protein
MRVPICSKRVLIVAAELVARGDGVAVVVAEGVFILGGEDTRGFVVAVGNGVGEDGGSIRGVVVGVERAIVWLALGVAIWQPDKETIEVVGKMKAAIKRRHLPGLVKRR